MVWVRKVIFDEWPKPQAGVGLYALLLIYGVTPLIVSAGIPVMGILEVIGVHKETRMMTGMVFLIAGVVWFYFSWRKVQRWH